MKAAVLSFLMLAAVAMGGLGFYSAQASADRVVSDGYGVNAAAR